MASSWTLWHKSVYVFDLPLLSELDGMGLDVMASLAKLTGLHLSYSNYRADASSDASCLEWYCHGHFVKPTRCT